MNPTIDTIIFDLGGVLIDWNPEYVYQQIFEDEQEMHHFLTHVCTPEWNYQQDAGRSLEEATEIAIQEHPHYEEEIRAFYDRWPEMLGGPIQETLDLLLELQALGTYRLLALTNWSGETFPIALEKYDFLYIFEEIVVSGDEQLAKPNPEIYRLLLDRYQVDPNRAIFVDDNSDNVAAAAEFGIHAFEFDTAELFRYDLVEFGVLS